LLINRFEKTADSLEGLIISIIIITDKVEKQFVGSYKINLLKSYLCLNRPMDVI